MSTADIALPDPFPPGARKLAFVEGRQILVFNIAGTLVAIDNSCPHAGGSLFGGKLAGAVLRCPSHGLKLDLASAACEIARHPIECAGGGAILTLPD